MKTLGRGSLAWGLFAFLGVARIVLFVIGAIVAIAALGTAAHYAGLFSLNGVDVIGPPMMTGLGFLIAGFTVVSLLVGVDRLRRIFATLADGDPFVPENAGHMRVLAGTLAVFEGVRFLAALIAMALTSSDTAQSVSVTVDISIGTWFGVLVLIVLAEVFQEGARLRAEQKLTI